ncbi:MAG TPA: hypothetical protein VMB80_10135 [Candidatus Acidoferrum sp.]|nr:hypothetical protein [Candidatus Acidoferrum sp.]
MIPGRHDIPGEKSVADDLEPYRRLVELQKQMIELAQQHERTRRRRDALHEQLAHDAARRRHERDGWRHRLQRSAANFLKRVPGLAVEKPALAALNDKQPSSC